MNLKRLLLLWLVLPVSLGAIVLTIYWTGLYGTFLFDDFESIVNNTPVRAFDGSLKTLIAAAISGMSSPLGRPISMASFALNYYFFGDSPFSFKFTNLVIHIANVLLIYGLARQLLRRLVCIKSNAWSTAAPIWISVVWALHPINLTPVLFVVQRMTSLSAFFMLCALSLYLLGRQAKNKLGQLTIGASILVCWPAAVFSKETGLLFPIYLFLIEWLLLGTLRSVSIKIKWAAALVIAGLFSVLCWEKWGFITAGYSVRDFDLLERLMTESRVLWFYIRQLLLPAPEVFGLFHDDILISRGLLTPPTTLLAVTGWILITALAFKQRTRRPLFAFAVFWFLASHLLESTIFPLEIAYEHRNYLASFGIFLWLGCLLFPDQKNAQWRIPRLALAASFVLFCGLLTSLRSSQWADEFQRTQVEVSDHPTSARANYQAAVAMMQRTYESGGGNPMAYQMVQFHFNHASELDKGSKAPLLGLLYLDCMAGVSKNSSIYVRLRERFGAKRFTFGDRAVIHSLSAFLVEGRLCLDDKEVKVLLDAGLSNPSADGLIRGMINAVAMDYASAKMHSTPLALAYAQAAVASDPGNVAFRINLIHMYIQSSRVEDARQEYRAVTSRQVSSRDKPGLDELKNIFDTIDKNANTR